MGTIPLAVYRDLPVRIIEVIGTRYLTLLDESGREHRCVHPNDLSCIRYVDRAPESLLLRQEARILDKLFIVCRTCKKRAPKTSPNALYCSKKCSRKYWRRAESIIFPERACQLNSCERKFTPKHKFNVFCSPLCEKRSKGWAGKTKPTKISCTYRKCDTLFIPQRDSNVFCSKLCRYKAKLERKRSLPLTRNCKVCNREFDVVSHNHVYCSEKCNCDAENASCRKELPEIKCRICPTIFKPFSKKALFCSLRCRNRKRWASRRLVQSKVCALERCGKTFETRNPRKKYCSTRCSERHNKLKPILSFTCAQCGGPFTTSKSYMKFCSYDCRRININERRYEALHGDPGSVNPLGVSVPVVERAPPLIST